MKNQRGFTLLEIILALVIFASCAMMVVSTIPSRSGADIFGQQLKALVDYGSDRAVMDGNIQNAMNQIGVQISSRFDALFAVLDLMKGYAADDIQPLMERAAARRSVITARSAPEEVSEQEQVIEETVKSIRLAAERNPLLCADKNYTKCMDAVECYGRMVYTSRLIYNDSVTKLNSALGMFPTNVIAGILGFHKREYLSQKGD
jgi:LemA protein